MRGEPLAFYCHYGPPSRLVRRCVLAWWRQDLLEAVAKGYVNYRSRYGKRAEPGQPPRVPSLLAQTLDGGLHEETKVRAANLIRQSSSASGVS
jgi:hypothetical protein